MRTRDNSRLHEQHPRNILSTGNIGPPTLISEGSNYTFLVDVTTSSQTLQAIYKPRSGEWPLSDFPPGTLYKREYAAYLVANFLSWYFIPCTIIREGPFGIGSLQEFVHADPTANYFTLRAEQPEELIKIALFDYLSNNADRKASHCLKDNSNRVWSIDHGLTFHESDKLRTVIWDFADYPIPASLLTRVGLLLNELILDSDLINHLNGLLTTWEITALINRIKTILESRCLPSPNPTRRNFPWPWF